MNDKEIWKDIPGIKNYQVSDFGRVKSLYHAVNYKRKNFKMECVKYVGGKILKPRIKSSNGLYPAYRVSISQNGCAKDYYIHRLVLLAFVGECPIGMECCHNDGNSLNNKVENLRWDTPKNNQADSIRHGTKSGIPICPSKGEKHYNSKLTEELIYELRELIVYRGMYKKLSEKYDVSPSTIRQAVKGITWKHL